MYRVRLDGELQLDLAKFSQTAVRLHKNKRAARRMSRSEIERLNDATLRETSPEEVERRMEIRRNQRG